MQQTVFASLVERFSTYFVFLLIFFVVALTHSAKASAATFTVTKTADTNDGVCDADCSLREAIAAANNAPTNDAVVFSPLFAAPQAISLTIGELAIAANSGTLTVNGTGATQLVIQRSTDPNTANFRIFIVNANASLALNDLTVANGRVNAGVSGGSGISNLGALVTTNVIVRNNQIFGFSTRETAGGGIGTSGTATLNNTIVSNNSFVLGGGISNSGTLTINRSLVTGNTATQKGGGIWNVTPGTINLNDSTVANNTVNNQSSGGGGIYNQEGTVNIRNSTFNNNTTTGRGGGIYNAGNLTAINATVSSNAGTDGGGGIYNANDFGTAVANLINLTVASNTATRLGGGGVLNFNAVNARNTIIADNTDNGSNGAQDYRGELVSQGFNLIENTTSATISGTTVGNITGLDPRLGSLENNGGLTATLALLPDSPAIDAADLNNHPPIDQRNIARPKDGNLDGVARPDIGAFERSLVVNGTAFDLDGDRRADISVFRPAEGNWYFLRSGSNNSFGGAVQWGLSSDRIAPADYDGDTRTDFAVWRVDPSNPGQAIYYILNSRDNTVRVEQFGALGDAPVPADFDADGRADLAVFRAGSAAGAQSQFFYRGSGTPGSNFAAIDWGVTGDVPAVGDYDADGRTDAAVFRPSNGTWYIRQSSNNEPLFVNWGLAQDKLVPADYDGDGKTDIAVYRNGIWYILQSNLNNQPRYEQFGVADDVPVAADYDGDARADIAVWRPSTGVWWLQQSNNRLLIVNFGVSSDKPVPAALLPSPSSNVMTQPKVRGRALLRQ